jgi:hypothetical protein
MQSCNIQDARTFSVIFHGGILGVQAPLERLIEVWVDLKLLEVLAQDPLGVFSLHPTRFVAVPPS